MSTLVIPLLQPLDPLPATLPLHVVLPGTSVCAACGLGKHRMRMRYTDSQALWNVAKEVRVMGLLDPITGFIEPYSACTEPAVLLADMDVNPNFGAVND